MSPLLITALAAAMLVMGIGGLAAPAPGPARMSVMDYGARGDGATDDTGAFQKALDAAAATGGAVVDVPAGKFAIRGVLRIGAAVTLQGVASTWPRVATGSTAAMKGSVLLAWAGRGEPTSPPFITLAGDMATVAGLIVTYPEWSRSDVPPVPYPPCVGSTDTENVSVLNCLFLNPYEAISMVRAHRHIVRNVTGYPSRRGLYVDQCYDIGHAENIHFWPFGVDYKPDDPYCLWVNTNGVAFEFARTDWHYVLNTFCFGYGIGYLFSQTKDGSANGNFVGLGADSCQRAVVVRQAQPAGLLITNGEFVGRWSSTDATCLDVEPTTEGKVSLVNCSFWGPIDRCIRMGAPNGQLTVSACHLNNWDIRVAGSPAIDLLAGRAIIQGSTFGSGANHVRIGSRVRSAIVTANQSAGGLEVVNEAGARAQIAMNERAPTDVIAGANTNYVVTIGGEGDGLYARKWHGRERLSTVANGRPYRWSTSGSELRLPAPAGKWVTVRVEVLTPAAALQPGAGIYQGSQCIAPISHAGLQTLVGRARAGSNGRVVLQLKCKVWDPSKLNAGSVDSRKLGVQALRATVKADGASEQVFDANTGTPIAKPEPPTRPGPKASKGHA